jgi:hypothetical protein
VSISYTCTWWTSPHLLTTSKFSTLSLGLPSALDWDTLIENKEFLLLVTTVNVPVKQSWSPKTVQCHNPTRAGRVPVRPVPVAQHFHHPGHHPPQSSLFLVWPDRSTNCFMAVLLSQYSLRSVARAGWPITPCSPRYAGAGAGQYEPCGPSKL